MATVKLVINKNSLKKDGTTPIYLQYSYSSEKRTLLHTNIFISPIDWNTEKTEIRRSAENHSELNDTLKVYKSQIEQIIRDAKAKGINPTIDYMRMEFERFLNAGISQSSDGKTFYEFFETFCEESKERIQKDSIKGYYALLKNLQSYEKHSKIPITFNTISCDFYSDFIDFLRNKVLLKTEKIGMTENTIGKQIKNLKTFLHYCFRKKWVQEFDIDFLKVLTEEIDAIFLDEDELTRIYEYDFSNNNDLAIVRDWLIIGCYTGLRFSDLSRLKQHNFKPNYIQSYQKKMRGSSVIIPYHPRVKEIAEKYKYSLPKIEYNDFNTQLKELGKRLGFDAPISMVHKKKLETEEIIYKKYELMSTHICRRSFCTNLYIKGAIPQTIMKISGHKTEKSFMKYIRIDNLMAAMEVQKLWGDEK